jgi:hypothetical protein
LPIRKRRDTEEKPRSRRDDDEDEDRYAPRDEDEDRGRRRRPRDEDDDDEERPARRRTRARDEDDEDEDDRPRRSRVRDDDDEDDEEDRPRRRRRSVRPRDDDDEDEDDEPKRGGLRRRSSRDDDEEDDDRPARRRHREDDEEDDDRPRSSRGSKDIAPAAVKKGWDGAREVADSTSSFANQLKLKEGEPQVIRFLEDEPYAAYKVHWLQRKGKRSFTCIDNPERDVKCPLCDLGDRARAMYAFNVAVLDPDKKPSVVSWDIGIRLFNQIEKKHKDPKIGPITAPYFAVTRTGKNTQAVTVLEAIKDRDLLDDWDIEPLSKSELRSLKGKLYDRSIVEVQTRKALKEIAAEQSTYEEDDDED